MPCLTECDQDDTCPRCQERGGMAIVVLAFAVIFAMGAGLLAGLRIGHQAAVAQAAIK